MYSNLQQNSESCKGAKTNLFLLGRQQMSTRINLRNMKMLEGLMPFKCEICDRSFTLKTLYATILMCILTRSLCYQKPKHSRESFKCELMWWTRHTEEYM